MAKGTRTGGRAATLGVIPGRMALSVGRPNLPEPDGFGWTSLETVARLESGHTPSRSRDDYWNGDIPWIGIRDATEHHGQTICTTNEAVTQLGIDNSSARVLPAGTVCLSRTASVGYVVVMGVPMATSQDFVNWVCGPQLNASYLRYVLMLEQDSVRRFAHGTTHQTMYYPEAKALHALLPSRSKQDAIAEVLGALDDKIAANSRILSSAKQLVNAELDSALAAGLETRTVDQLAIFHNRRRIPLSANQRKERAGEVPYFGAAGPIDTVDEALFDEEIVLVGEDGSVMTERGGPVVQYVWGPCWVNNHAHVLTGYSVSTPFLRSLIERGNVAPLVTGAVQPKLSMGNLKRLELRVPINSSGLQERVDAHAAIERAKTSESRLLASIRDALLPLLMSGKVTIKNAQSVVGEVL